MSYDICQNNYSNVIDYYCNQRTVSLIQLQRSDVVSRINPFHTGGSMVLTLYSL
jgi:hypothetical protein